MVSYAPDFGPRAAVMAKDPAVQKAWLVAGKDVARAFKSTAEAVSETRAAWLRAGGPLSRDFAAPDSLTGFVSNVSRGASLLSVRRVDSQPMASRQIRMMGVQNVGVHQPFA